MSDSTIAASPDEPTEDSTRPSATPTQQIIAISVCVVAFRVYMELIERSPLVLWQHVGAPTWAVALLCLLAAGSSLVAAQLASRWFAGLVVTLFAIMFGAGATLPLSTIPGAFIGGFVGSLVAFGAWRRAMFGTLRFLLKYGLPPFALAAVVAFAASTRRGLWEIGSVHQLMTALGVVLVVITIANAARALRASRTDFVASSDNSIPKPRPRLLRFVWGSVFSLCMLAIGWISGLEMDNYRVNNKLLSGAWVYAGFNPIERWPLEGLHGQATRGWIWDNATDDDLRLLNRFHDLRDLRCTLGPQVTAEGTSHLGSIPIENLVLSGSDDARNEFLSEQTSLCRLDLEGSREIGDGTLRHLNCKRTLYSLFLGGTKVTDVGLEKLKDYGALTVVRLQDTETSDAGVAHLSALPLSTLVLENTKVSASCLNTIKNMSTLNSLNIGKTAITIADLQPLAKSKTLQLRELNLSGQQVGNDEVTLLQSFPALMSLTIRDCGIDDAAAVRLAGLPYLEIDVWKLSKPVVRQLKPTVNDECYFGVDNKHVTKSEIERLIALDVEILFEDCTFDEETLQILETDVSHQPFTIWDLNCDPDQADLISLNSVNLRYSQE